MLLSGNYTKKEIGDFYGVTSSHICKINKGMKEPNHSHSRWSDIN
jgi:DNA-directed RNA polymerase specialized sigma subunit